MKKLVMIMLSLNFMGVIGNATIAPETIDLVCLKETAQQMIVYHLIVEPEMSSAIPENPSSPIHTGEWLATVKIANYPEEPGVTLYSGAQEFSLIQTGLDAYRFKSEKLGLDLVCEHNGEVGGGGGFSGSN